LEIDHFPSPQEFQNKVIYKGPIRTDTGDETLTVACIKDRKKISPDKRFATSKIDLKDLMLFKLIDQSQALIERKFPFLSLSRSGKAMDTGKVALVRYLPGHIDRSG
jgi:hypothetical protein